MDRFCTLFIRVDPRFPLLVAFMIQAWYRGINASGLTYADKPALLVETG
jgi:hypothetical protein